jgi:hypothetical protein
MSKFWATTGGHWPDLFAGLFRADWLKFMEVYWRVGKLRYHSFGRPSRPAVASNDKMGASGFCRLDAIIKE